MSTANFIESFIGPSFAILWLSFILYGIFLSQVYFYCTTYRDHWSVRLLVFVLCILETLLVITCMHLTYTYVVIDWGDIEKASKVVWSIGMSIYLEIITSGLVQGFYMFRIWRLSHNRPVIAYLVTVSCVRLAIGFKANAYACVYKDWTTLTSIQAYREYTTAALATNVLVDSSTTLVLTYYLRRNQTLTHKRSTKNTIRRLIGYVVGSGALTMMTSITILILFNASKNTLYYGGLLLMVPRVYTNSMLTMLNIRQGIKNHALLDNAFSLELSNLPGNQVSIRPHVPANVVQVIRDTVSTGDDWQTSKPERNAQNTERSASIVDIK